MAMCLLALGSCQKNEDGGKVFMTFHATAEQSNAKTHLNNGSAIYWNEGDKIGVFTTSSETSYEFEVENIQGTQADFSGHAQNSNAYIGLYPYDEFSTISGTTITTSLPSLQTAVAGSFDPKANIMTAYSEGTDFDFKNVCAYLKVTSPYDCTSIQIISNGDRMISGLFSADITTDGTPSNITPLPLAEQDDYNRMGSKYIRLYGNIEQGEDYYIAILPGTLDGGFTIKFWGVSGDANANRSYNSTLSTSYTLDRKVIYPLNNLANTPEDHIVPDGAVDLGLPSGTLWATKNIGANSSTDFGYFFKFGDNNASSYDDVVDAGYPNAEFVDAATIRCGNEWATPTAYQFSELIHYCSLSGNSSSILFTGSNGNAIFLPNAGSFCPTSTSPVTRIQRCCYWTKTYEDGYCYHVEYDSTYEEFYIVPDQYNRNHAYPIRPVVNNW